MTRTGDEYLAGLKDGREIWLGGERIDDVTTHPAFRNAAQTFAHLYDMTHDAEFRDVLTYESPATGDRVSRAYQIPQSYEDLVARRKAIKTWSEATYGFMGRTPDYKAVIWSAFATVPEIFDVGDGGAERAENVRRHYEFLRDNDLFQGHAIVNPQINRAKNAADQPEEFLYVGVVKERDDGIVVRGAKMIATGAMFADEMHVSTIAPLGPGDEKYAVAFSVPMSTPGVKLFSRTSYEKLAPSVFDNPISSRFDETDALMIFDDVLIPWDRVFIYNDVELTYSHWFDSPAQISMIYQFAIRQWTKLEFLLGLAMKLTQVNGTFRVPAIRARLSAINSNVQTVKALVLGAEANYELFETNPSVVNPNREMTFTFQIICARLYTETIDNIRWLIGGGPMQMPATFEALTSPEIGDTARRYLQGADADGENRMKIVKAVWDAVGTESASRHELYERFALGPPHITSMIHLHEGNLGVYEALADDLLGSYSLQDAIAESKDGWKPNSLATSPRPAAVRTGAVEGEGTIASVSKQGIKVPRPNPIVAMSKQKR